MENLDLIKGLINKKLLQEAIDTNKDAYSKACFDVAINVMQYLDNFEGDFNIGYYPDLTTPHGIICKCDNQGGISGFMAGAARNIVIWSYVSGWKFYLADALDEYNINNNEKVSEIVEKIAETKLVSYDDARQYADGLILRYKEKHEAL